MDLPLFDPDKTLHAIERVGLDVLGQFVLIEASFCDQNGDYQTFRLSLTTQAAQELQLAIGKALVERVFLIDKK